MKRSTLLFFSVALLFGVGLSGAASDYPLTILRAKARWIRALSVGHSSRELASFALRPNRYEWAGLLYQQRQGAPTLFGQKVETQIGNSVLRYEPYLIAPTSHEDMDSGLTFVFAQRLGWEVPMGRTTFYIRERAYVDGYSAAARYYENSMYANPRFETRLTVGWDVPLGHGVVFSLPVNWEEIKYHEQDGARYSGRWRHWMWAAPQLSFVMGRSAELVVSYTTDSFIGSNTAEVAVWSGIRDGLAELTLKWRL